MKKLSRYFRLIPAFLCALSACQKEPSQVTRKLFDSYAVYWKADTNFVIFQNFQPNEYAHRDSNKYYLADLENSKDAHCLVEVSPDSIILGTKNLDSKTTTNNFIEPNIPWVYLCNLPLPPKTRFTGDESRLTANDLSRISTHGIHADRAVFSSHDPLSLHLDFSTFDDLKLVGNISKTTPALTLDYETFHNDQTLSEPTANVLINQWKLDQIILNHKIAHLKISDCKFDQYSAISGFLPDTLELAGNQFPDTNSKLNLQGLNQYQRKTPTVLIIRNTDISKIDFDYTLYAFYPYSESSKDEIKKRFHKIYHDPYQENYRYSTDKKTFDQIILNQKRGANQGGITKAEIDSAKFEDRQLSIAPVLIPIKTWWNNYGYQKGTVIYSVLELFIFFFIFNLLTFKKLMEAYEVQDVADEYKTLAHQRNGLMKHARKTILCFLYTGYLFFGYKLELDKLKLARIRLALWVILQYLAGIISLAYIANLIITK